MPTRPFLTNSVQIFRTISCFYPPNPLGFCFSHPEVPETPTASHEFFGESQAQMNVWSALRFSKVTGRSSQNELSGVGNDWGCGTQVFIALKSGRKGWAEMWPWRWSFSDLQRLFRRFDQIRGLYSYRILATIIVVTTVSIVAAVVTVLQDKPNRRLYQKSNQNLIIRENNGIDEEAS